MTNRIEMETQMTEPTIKTDDEILELLSAEFPANQLKKLSGFSYIPEPIVRQRLTDVLGLSWNWEIAKETETDFKGKGAVVVTGRLTLKLPSGNVVIREAHGGSALDNGRKAGDAYKTAGSNALKKAAYLAGVGAYLGLNSAEGVDDTTSWGSGNSSQGSASTPASWGGQSGAAGGDIGQVATPVQGTAAVPGSWGSTTGS